MARSLDKASPAARRFDTVLIANRGEIAVRIQRACSELGLKTVAICSEADRQAPYGKTADTFLCIGPSNAASSYLNPDAILLAARLTGAGAIHPGYGFLSENAAFSEVVERAGLAFIGPEASSIAMMGDKISAKRAMILAGVPCVPGPDTALPDDQASVERIAEEIGYPVIIKAAGGGGGRGMRVVPEAGELHEAVTLTREEARQAFGSPALYMEKFLQHPRHIEIQVLCDTYGNAVWLGHRDCSMQRRHQKVVEEAPAPGISLETIKPVGLACVEACRQIGYRGVGTFEFLYENGAFYFIEMNTRLQVEHPVTEMTSGIDIVQAQIKVALGFPVEMRQHDVACSGHSIECRINAEDPESFLPSAGTISNLALPEGPGIRVDTHIHAGYRVSPYYDSLIAKLIVHAPTRAEAMAKMREALAATRIEGLSTNLPLLRALFEDEAFAGGETDIHYLEQWASEEEGGMSAIDFSDPAIIATLADALTAAGVDGLEISKPGVNLRIVVSKGMGAQVSVAGNAQPSVTVTASAVKAPMAGHFHPLPPPGSDEIEPLPRTVSSHDVIGFIRIGFVRLPILAGRSGLLTRQLAEPETLVGFGDPLFEIGPAVMIATANTITSSREIAPAAKGRARISCIGSRSFLLEAPGEFDLPAQRRIWALAQAVKGWADITEVIPGMTNLLTIFKETPEDPELAAGRLLAAWNNAESLDLAGKIIEIPVHYGGTYAIDLPAICDFCGLSDREVVRLHHEASYRVFALGSAPGFGYLHGLDPRIYMPRKTIPSLRMEKGSVTIGGMQTGVAMLTGPNGWNSLGHAELQMFDPTSATPALMMPGDIVRFLPARIEL